MLGFLPLPLNTRLNDNSNRAEDDQHDGKDQEKLCSCHTLTG